MNTDLRADSGRESADRPSGRMPYRPSEKKATPRSAQMKISHDDAAKQFDDIQANLKQTRDKAFQVAKDTADASASAASKTAFAGFGVLLLGLIAAAIGGSLASSSGCSSPATS